MKYAEITKMTVAELDKELKEQKEMLFNLRFQHSIHQLENPNKIVETKRTIARILTYKHQSETKASQTSGKEQ